MLSGGADLFDELVDQFGRLILLQWYVQLHGGREEGGREGGMEGGREGGREGSGWVGGWVDE